MHSNGSNAKKFWSSKQKCKAGSCPQFLVLSRSEVLDSNSCSNKKFFRYKSETFTWDSSFSWNLFLSTLCCRKKYWLCVMSERHHFWCCTKVDQPLVVACAKLDPPTNSQSWICWAIDRIMCFICMSTVFTKSFTLVSSNLHIILHSPIDIIETICELMSTVHLVTGRSW